TLRFSSKTGNAIINELHESLNELNVILQEAKVQSQIKERYFGEILKNIATGVIVVTEKGFVTDVNSTALDLLGLKTLTHLSQLSRIGSDFKKEIAELKSAEKKMLNLQKKNEKIQVVTRCSVIRLKNEDVRIITLQDIRGELERKEIDSWVKLIRVLSHEIMNSLAPVTSIAQSLKGIWKERIKIDQAFSKDSDVESTIGGLDVIGERGEALIRFVQSYRILTRVPHPNLALVKIQSLVESLNILVSPFNEAENIDIKIHCPKCDFLMNVDLQMLIQVIINLVKNSTEAISNQKDGKVDVFFYQKENEKVHIEIADNGPGIPDYIKDEIFVPFFTTKESGTGVGLSYSRQVIRAMGGTITCETEVGKTMFVIKL
nr:ATP-binding protein [Prolixibacteraceae bacterium]